MFKVQRGNFGIGKTRNMLLKVTHLKIGAAATGPGWYQYIPVPYVLVPCLAS